MKFPIRSIEVAILVLREALDSAEHPTSFHPIERACAIASIQRNKQAIEDLSALLMAHRNEVLE